MRVSHRDDNEDFEANSQQAHFLYLMSPTPARPSLVSKNLLIGISSLKNPSSSEERL